MTDTYCPATATAYPKWSLYDALLWKLAPEGFGGGRVRLEAYKDAWIVYNQDRILREAKKYAIPADLLGCVAYNEVGETRRL